MKFQLVTGWQALRDCIIIEADLVASFGEDQLRGQSGLTFGCYLDMDVARAACVFTGINGGEFICARRVGFDEPAQNNLFGLVIGGWAIAVGVIVASRISVPDFKLGVGHRFGIIEAFINMAGNHDRITRKICGVHISIFELRSTRYIIWPFGDFGGFAASCFFSGD